MEKLTNCDIIIDIEFIENISGGNQNYEILFLAKDGEKYKIIFDFALDIRCSIESAYIDRATKFLHAEKEKSSVLLIENSEYFKYFESQVSGTRPVDNIKNYIIFDSVDTIIEVLTMKDANLVRLS